MHPARTDLPAHPLRLCRIFTFGMEVAHTGRVVRRCWVKFQCLGVLLVWIIVGQGPSVLAVGAGGGCLDILSLIYHFSSFSLGWLVGCFGFNGPLRQYFSLYRAVSQREGERGKKG